MKKLAILSMMALCLGFTACDEVEMADSKPQTHPQEAIFNTDDMTFAPADGVLALQQANDEGTEVTVGVLNVQNWPSATYVPALVMELSADDSFAKVQKLDVTLTPREDDPTAYVCSVRPDLLNKVYTTLVSKDPAQGNIVARFVPEATSEDGAAVVRIGGPDFYFGPAQYPVLPLTPGTTIEDSYILYVSTNADLSGAQQIVMNNGGGSPYDDPTFAAVYDNSAAATLYWAISPASGEPMWTAAEADANEGSVVEAADAYGVCSVAGNVKFEYNAEKQTYKYYAAIECFYCPSDYAAPKKAMAIYTNDFRTYRGFFVGKGEMLFTWTTKWKDALYLNPDVEVEKTETSIAGGVMVGGEQYIKLPAGLGLYWAVLDYTALTFKIDFIQTLGLIGDFNDWSAQANMTPNKDYTTWTSPVVHMSAGQGWKFRANDDWGINLGGGEDGLYYDGANITVAEDGDYIVTLDLTTNPYTCVMTKQ